MVAVGIETGRNSSGHAALSSSAPVQRQSRQGAHAALGSSLGLVHQEGRHVCRGQQCRHREKQAGQSRPGSA